MRVIIKPSLTPNLHLDVTNALVSTIAHELARVQGGNDVLNWLEAERALRDLLTGSGAAAPTPGRLDDPGEAGAEPLRRRTRRPIDVGVGPRFADERAPMSATRG